MANTLLSVGLLFVGTYFFILGVRILFQKGYVEKTFDNSATKWFSSKSVYNYNKYNRGISLLIFGLIFIGFGIYMLLF